MMWRLAAMTLIPGTLIFAVAPAQADEKSYLGYLESHGFKYQNTPGLNSSSGAVKFGEISSRLADNKCQHIVNNGAETVVLGDLGCMLNIEGRLRRRGDATRVLHVAEVLAGELPASG